MSEFERASITPFVCKWLGVHSRTHRFSTQEELEHHVYNDHKDLTKLKAIYRGCPIYNCPWDGCKKQLSDIPKLKEHLREHTQQRPFMCPICNDSRQFESFDRLNQHLIFNHLDNVVDYTGTVDMTKPVKEKKVVKSAKYDEKDDDYLICKALAKHYDRESYEKILVKYGFTDVIDLDEFF